QLIISILPDWPRFAQITPPQALDTPSYIVKLISSKRVQLEISNQPLVLISISLQVVPLEGLFVNVRGNDSGEDILNNEERVVLSITQTIYSFDVIAFDINTVASNVLHYSSKEHEFESFPIVPTQYDSPETSNELCDMQNINRI
ncbi:MAG: hypothetical protein EZS28_049072, partial [Streblomastix strix]